jgi:hypothetical protein
VRLVPAHCHNESIPAAALLDHLFQSAGRSLTRQTPIYLPIVSSAWPSTPQVVSAEPDVEASDPCNFLNLSVFIELSPVVPHIVFMNAPQSRFGPGPSKLHG